MSTKTSMFEGILSLIILTCASQAQADFHFWSINELFSSSDGNVQYIELATTLTGQHVLSGHTLVSSNGIGTDNIFDFPTNLNGDTANKTLLIATEKFAAITGLTPDYFIPEQFIFVTGGSVNFGESTDILSFSKEILPLNGVQSIDGNAQPQTATPKNFAGLSAALSLDSHATFDAGSSVMNVPVLSAPGIGIANVSFTVNLGTLQFTLLDNFYLYGAGIGEGNSPAQFQSNSILYIPGLVVGNELYEFNLVIQGDDPIVFGNPSIINVTNIVDEPPQQSELQLSINRGQTEFQTTCFACHGSGGEGGIGPNLQVSELNTFSLLRDFIGTSMPQDNPAGCQDSGSSTCATDAANYVLNVIQGSGSGIENPGGDITY